MVNLSSEAADKTWFIGAYANTNFRLFFHSRCANGVCQRSATTYLNLDTHRLTCI